MNVFIIPSWYPHDFSPQFGIFCKDHALAIGEQRPDWNVGVSLWGQGLYSLPLAQLHAWPRKLFHYFLNKKAHRKTLIHNIHEWITPALQPSHLLFREKKASKLAYEACRQNFLRFTRYHGKTHIIHAHVVYPGGVFAQRLSEEFDIPYFITEHTGPFPPACFLKDSFHLKDQILNAFQRAVFTFGASPYQVEKLKKFHISNVKLLPNLIDEDTFTLPSPIKNEKFTFLTVALKLSKQKGIEDWLHAIHQLRIKHPIFMNQCLFRIIGLDPSNHYQCLAKKLAIDSHIQWIGTIDRQGIIKEFQKCDCFALPSHQETFGCVYAEALASGKPVLATFCGGAEFVVEKNQGHLVPVQDPNALMNGILYMIREHGKYDPRIIRQRTLDRFSKKIIIKQLEDYYSNV